MAGDYRSCHELWLPHVVLLVALHKGKAYQERRSEGLSSGALVVLVIAL